MAGLVLASGSPRRRELLSGAGLEFEVLPSGVDEEAEAPRLPPSRLATYLALTKALDVAWSRPEGVVLGADTVVVLSGQPLGKPRDAEEARATLQWLSGRSHRVITAVCLLQPRRPQRLTGLAVTRVRLRRLGEPEIEASIARGDPFDKAGAYAIQDEALRPVESYEGCYCNVVGLPVGLAAALLARAGIAVARRPLPQCAECPLW